METINSILGSMLDGLLRQFHGAHPFWPLLILSALMGMVLLGVFRFTSNQQGIQETKNRIKAHLLEIRLFKDDLGALLSAQGSILKYNLQYMAYGLKPLLVIIIPVAVMLIQCEGWFGSRPLKPGEFTLVSAFMSADESDNLPLVELEVSDGLSIETPSLRIPAVREIDWKIKAEKPGEHYLLVKLKGKEIAKSVTVSTGGLARVSPVRPSADFWSVALHPGESPIPKDDPVREISLDYPSRSIDVFGWKLHWLLVFFVLSTLSGFLFKGLFKVEI
ncbi:MAG TPA: hypothetical protein VMW38_13670 [Terriglobia bacterium]|nr:hypothetical protein [Terriglobia bacterium]